VHIKVKTLTGKIYNDISIDPEQTVEALSDAITAQIPTIPRKGQKLVYSGKILESQSTVASANIKDGDFVVLLIGRAAPLPSIDPIPEPNVQAIIAATTQHINMKDDIEEDKDEEKEADKMEVEKSEEKPLQPNTLSEGMLKDLVDTIVGSLSPQIRKSGSQKRNPTGNTADGNPSAPRLPTVDPSALRQLQDLGFPENRARKALLLHKMNGQLAMEWLLMHNEDADIDEPLSAEQLHHISDAEASFEPNPETARQLQEMGFDAEEVNQALRVTRNNQESALAWLLGDRGDNRGAEYEGDEKGSDDEDDDLPDSELVQAMLSNPQVKEALGEPRVVAALEKLMENPSNVEVLLQDEEIGPILQRLNNLLNTDM